MKNNLLSVQDQIIITKERHKEDVEETIRRDEKKNQNVLVKVFFSSSGLTWFLLLIEVYFWGNWGGVVYFGLLVTRLLSPRSERDPV